MSEHELADAAQLASLADETPEGRSIVVLAKQKFDIRERDVASLGAKFVHFSAATRMSGVDTGAAVTPCLGGAAQGDLRQIRKGAADAVMKHVEAIGGRVPAKRGR